MIPYEGIVVGLAQDGAFRVQDVLGNEEICVIHTHSVDYPPRVGERVLYKKGTSVSFGVIISIVSDKKLDEGKK